MSSYIISKDIDLSEEFEELSYENQKQFIIGKFENFNGDVQEEMLKEIVTEVPDYNLTKVIKKAFDNLSCQYQAEMVEYIEDSNIA